MGKVNLLVKYCLINQKNEYNIKGILINKEIKFFDNDCLMILNKEKNTLKRIIKEEEILFDFYNKKCYVFSKENNIKIDFPIKVIEFKNTDKDFYVKYKIDENLFELMIEII